MSTLHFITGSNATTISTFSFDPAASSNADKITLINQTVVADGPSWIEPPANHSLTKVFYTLSEPGGKVFSFKVNDDGKVEVTGSAPTGGFPAHIHAKKDGSGIIATNYLGGTAVFYPTDPTTGALSPPSSLLSSLASSIPIAVTSLLPTAALPPPPTPPLKFDFTYSHQKTGPRTDRQEDSHPHQTVEDPQGRLYVPDLGSDRIWVVEKEGEYGLKLAGALELPAGAGPRHAVITPDGKHLYVLSELTHKIYIFSLPTSFNPTTLIQPLDSEGTLVISPSLPSTLHPHVTAGELQISPISPRTLYATSRGQVELNSNPQVAESNKVSGDAVAIVSLSEDGSRTENVEIVQTGCAFIRALGLTSDGRYLGVVGQKDNNIEIYEVSGERGEKVKLVAELKDGKSGLDLATDFKWY